MTRQALTGAIEALKSLIACHDEPDCPAVQMGKDALEALEKEVSRPEPSPVAMIGSTYALLWTGPPTLSELCKLHPSLKVGSMLYLREDL